MALALLAALAAAPRADGARQRLPEVMEEWLSGPDASRVGSFDPDKPPPLVNADEELTGFLFQAQQLIKQKEYARAIQILQTLIARPDSGFVAAPDGRQYVSLWLIANELIGRMDQDGLRLYRRLYEPQAQELYDQAASSGDEGTLVKVPQLYLHTVHGARSLDALGAIAFDRGRFSQAARLWERAIWLPAAKDSEAVLLARIAVAHHLALEEAEAKNAADTLKAKHSQAAAVLGGRRQNLVEFVQRALTLAPPAAQGGQSVEGWPGLGGVPNGMGVMVDSKVVLSPRWRYPEVEPAATEAVNDKLIAMRSSLQGQSPDGRGRVSLKVRNGHLFLEAARGVRTAEGLQVSGFYLPAVVHPVVVGETVICRQDDAVVAYNVFTGEAVWSGGGRLEKEPSPGGAYRMIRYFPTWQVGDCGNYALTVGGGKVFAISNYASFAGTARIGIAFGVMAVAPKEPLDTSCLKALSLPQQGKLLWSVGDGSGDDEVVQCGKFLTAPTYHAGRLYVIVLHLESYHLVCLSADTGSLLWHSCVAQMPATPRRMGSNIDFALYRGSPVALADGVAFALTNNGAVAAFEADTGRAIWAYQYSSKVNTPSGFQHGLISRYGGIVMPPNPILVAQGRVICLPCDSANVIALSVEDGHPVWPAEVDRQNQANLSAIDDNRILLSGDALIVLSASDGKQLHKEERKGIQGRPAVTTKAVLAGGEGKVYRLSLSDYRLESMDLVGPGALLGNLVSVEGKLIAANSAGICAYFNYDHAREGLTNRLVRAGEEDKAQVLFQRGQLAFRAEDFEQALKDFLDCSERAQRGGDSALGQQVGPWLYRTCVALGNRAKTPAEMLSMFQRAQACAASGREKAHMKIRLAKYHEKAGDLAAAVALAQEVAEEYATMELADVGISPEADDTARLGPETEGITGRAWAQDNFIKRLIEIHGQKVYAEQDAQAKAALGKALAADDPEALAVLVQHWPNSMWADDAMFDAAEICYRRGLASAGAQAQEALDRACKYLSAVSNTPLSELRISANVGLAAIYARRGYPVVAAQALAQVRDAPSDSQVKFADILGKLGDKIREIDNRIKEIEEGKSLPPAADFPFTSAISPPLEKVYSLVGEDVVVLRDQEYRPVRLAQNVFVLNGRRVVMLDTSARKEPGEDQWSALVSVDLEQMRRQPYVPGVTLLGAMSKDQKVLAVADRTGIRGLDVETAKVCWNKTMAELDIPSFACISAGEGSLVVVDQTGKITCVDVAKGEVVWKAAMVGGNHSPLAPPQIAGHCVLVRDSSLRVLTCFDLASGRTLGKWEAKQSIEGYLTGEALLAVMCDGELTVREVGRMGTPLWSRRYGAASGAAILGIAPDKIAVAPDQAGNEVKVLSFAGGGRSLAEFRLSDIGGERAVGVDAVFDGQYLYVTCSAGPIGQRKVIRGRFSPSRGLNVHKFDLQARKLLWSRTLETAQRYLPHLLPLTVGQKHLVIVAREYQVGAANYVCILDSQTGEVQQPRIDLTGQAGKVTQEVRQRRLMGLGPPVMTNGRLCVETCEGVSVYGGQ